MKMKDVKDKFSQTAVCVIFARMKRFTKSISFWIIIRESF